MGTAKFSSLPISGSKGRINEKDGAHITTSERSTSSKRTGKEVVLFSANNEIRGP
jgi:hypothetical protein